jgi:hypothetical protein
VQLIGVKQPLPGALLDRCQGYRSRAPTSSDEKESQDVGARNAVWGTGDSECEPAPITDLCPQDAPTLVALVEDLLRSNQWAFIG